MKPIHLAVLVVTLLSIHLGMAETPREITAAERLEALIRTIAEIPDFSPEPERMGPDGLPLIPSSVLARGKDEKAVREYYTEAGSQDLVGQLVFLANLYGRVVGRLQANERDAAQLPTKGGQMTEELQRKLGLFTGIRNMSAERITDPALRKEVQAVIDQEHRFWEYSYWKRRLEDMRDNLGRAFDHKADAAYRGKAKSVEGLLRDLEAAGADRKLVQQLVEALKRRNRMPDF